MSAKHTPGPWRIDSRNGVWSDEKDEFIVEAGDVTRIAGPNGEHVCGTCDGCNKIKIDDARLIAAAPALADALEALLDHSAAGLTDGKVAQSARIAAREALRAAGRLP